MNAPSLIISDIDGTFLNSYGRVTPRLLEVVARAVRGGTKFALATGRPHRWLLPVLEQLPFEPLCVAANGAVIYDPEHDEVVKSFALSPESMEETVGVVEKVMGEAGVTVGYGVERLSQSALDPEEECFLITPEYNPDAWDARFGVVHVEELIAEPAAKLLVRCPDLMAEEMFDMIAPEIDQDIAHVTYSMEEGLLEFSRPGVTKAAGVSYLAAQYGIDPSRVVAFGDMQNDVEMLAWAGMGVAMGNATEAVKDAADTVTASNDEDGVAKVLEHWF